MVDYAEHMVESYLKSERRTFIQPQSYIDIEANGQRVEFYPDALALNLSESTLFVCEVKISVEETPVSAAKAMLKAVGRYEAYWDLIGDHFRRKIGVPAGFLMRSWLFLPEKSAEILVPQLGVVTRPRITPLEMCAAWRYRNWDRIGEKDKPAFLAEFAG